MAEKREVCISDAAAYIAETCGELRRVSRHPKLRVVNYLLDMAREAAAEVVKSEQATRDKPR